MTAAAAVSATIHPIRASLARLREHYAYLPDFQVGVPDEPGWLPATEVFDPDQGHLSRLLAGIAAQYEECPPDVAASFAFHRYGWSIATLAFGSVLTDQRLPDLRLSNVAVHFDDQDEIDGLALASGTFWTTAGDPEADHLDARVLPDGDLSMDRVRLALEAHCEPVIEAIRAGAPLGTRAMWLSLADNCAWCLLTFGDLLHRPGNRAGEIEALTRAPGSKLRGGTRLMLVEHEGEHHPFVARGSCCLSYKLPGSEKCVACPLHKGAEREARMRRYLAEEATA